MYAMGEKYKKQANLCQSNGLETSKAQYYRAGSLHEHKRVKSDCVSRIRFETGKGWGKQLHKLWSIIYLFKLYACIQL